MYNFQVAMEEAQRLNAEILYIDRNVHVCSLLNLFSSVFCSYMSYIFCVFVLQALYTLLRSLAFAQCFIKCSIEIISLSFSYRSPGDVWLDSTGNCKEIKRRHYSVGCVTNAEKPQSS
jgi:hypothetical protein